jgi:hypothetical protein
MDSGTIVLKNIRRDIPALKPLAAKVICLQKELIEAVKRYQVSFLFFNLSIDRLGPNSRVARRFTHRIHLPRFGGRGLALRLGTKFFGATTLALIGLLHLLFSAYFTNDMSLLFRGFDAYGFANEPPLDS